MEDAQVVTDTPPKKVRKGAAKKGKDSPAMQQYFRAKAQHPDAILFFRLGDFYEMFFEDAVVVSELLDLTLTSRSKTAEGEKIPMAGVPHHAAAGYIARLLEKGRNVALCEQMADPSTVKGVVPREVVRVITPGLNLDPESLDARAHNYLVVVVAEPSASSEPERVGLAALELSTADARACTAETMTDAMAELVRIDPREVLLAEALEPYREALSRALPRAVVRTMPVPTEGFELTSVLGEEAAAEAESALGTTALTATKWALRYASEAQKGASLGVLRVVAYDTKHQLMLDEAAVRNLELVRTLGGERVGSLLHLVDMTRSPLGARELKRRILAPLTDVAQIRRRHDVVEVLVGQAGLRAELRGHLAMVGDLERLVNRCVLGLATPRDLGGLRNGLRAARAVAETLASSGFGGEGALRVATSEVPFERPTSPPKLPFDAVLRTLENALVEEPPAVLHQGGVFRDGLDDELDRLRRMSRSSKDVVLEVEQRERARTGISSLKVRFNKVFGYYIEVTKSNLSAVPPDYQRKQTIANGERFVTEELNELQETILHADDKAQALETERFFALRSDVAQASVQLQTTAAEIADLDVHVSFAELAQRFDYVRPTVNESLCLALDDGRHPIVEQLSASGEFVPNDVRLDAQGESLMVITGPNMAGKSTVMRQVALSVVLAQAGAFVPARSAQIGLVDRIFTRVGASDNLSRGQSTFMVEMQESATILKGATQRSLVVLDEIGRGTSTYDGLAIAWAVAEHLADAVRCRAMFATHYHELCDLSASRKNVVNFNVAAKERGHDVVFLHKLTPGGANRSYGVAVAKLAGIPEVVVARARAILQNLEAGLGTPGASEQAKRDQLALFVPARDAKPSEVESTLRTLDINRLTPIEALVALERLKSLAEQAES